MLTSPTSPTSPLLWDSLIKSNPNICWCWYISVALFQRSRLLHDRSLLTAPLSSGAVILHGCRGNRSMVRGERKGRRWVKTQANPEQWRLHFPWDRLKRRDIGSFTSDRLIYPWNTYKKRPAAVKCAWQDYGTPPQGCHDKNLHFDLLHY